MYSIQQGELTIKLRLQHRKLELIEWVLALRVTDHSSATKVQWLTYFSTVSSAKGSPRPFLSDHPQMSSSASLSHEAPAHLREWASKLCELSHWEGLPRSEHVLTILRQHGPSARQSWPDWKQLHNPRCFCSSWATFLDNSHSPPLRHDLFCLLTFLFSPLVYDEYFTSLSPLFLDC